MPSVPWRGRAGDARRKVAPFGAEVGSRLSHGPRLVRSLRRTSTSSRSGPPSTSASRLAAAPVLLEEGVEVGEQARGSIADGMLVPIEGSTCGKAFRAGKTERVDSFQKIRDDPGRFVDGQGRLPRASNGGRVEVGV